jgi:cupin fold WbuC family metalloprotein
MLNFYSKVNPDILLFTMISKDKITTNRINLTPPEEFMQAAAKKTKKNDYFKPHRHLLCEKSVNITQEAWVILDGKAEGTFFDIDNKIIKKMLLNDGDCVIIYNGAHSLLILEDNTILYEFKNGPYLGPEKDKEFI